MQQRRLPGTTGTTTWIQSALAGLAALARLAALVRLAPVDTCFSLTFLTFVLGL